MKQKKDINELLALATQTLSLAEQENIKHRLVEHVNYLILNDFPALIQVLYRVDVSENKLKNLLRSKPGTDAAILITNMLLERQAEKIKSRQSESKSSNKKNEFIDPDLEW
ncbi:MAG TPA: hypothetical protein VNS32_05540 [Flavisolibacter sp.]|nr:hypothetical protein [Flavisolibacter sp.]